MAAQYEAHVKCEKTDKEVSTGYVVPSSRFVGNDKPHGVFNCPACKQNHHWSYEQATIRLVAK